MKRLFLVLLVVFAVLPAAAQAWWNPEWTGRRKVSLDTTDQGAALKEGLANVPVLVRLHTGNFVFNEAQIDGNDLRFIADDDKTPLEFHIEKFDGVNELALVWVKVPRMAPGSAEGHVWLYYGNEKAVAAGNPKGTYTDNDTLVMHFAEADGAFRDSTAYAQPVAVTGVKGGGAGVADGAAVFDGSGRLNVTAPSLASGPGGMTVSAWVKPANAEQKATLFSQQGGALQVNYEAGQVWVVTPVGTTGKVDLPAGAWHHVAVTLGDRIVLHVDGRESAAVAAKAAAVTGEVVIGAGFQGELDELAVANTVRSAGAIALAVASQGEAAKLVKVATEAEAGEGGESTSYVGILLSAVTIDGWVVIAILMVMMVLSFYVMFTKTIVMSRTDNANKAFQKRFAEIEDLLAAPGDTKGARHATLRRIYDVASGELRKRLDSGKTVISGKSIDAIRATMDAQVVRESARLNSQMVLLTISISGGPFLGLLGTVVGVMITFAAIAAAGDVNVNAIAPGIAAALVATVAGLAVAIPALFGYNYLASQIKVISADMQVFVDELTSRIAERYAD
jgi:biopolymer transport protein ExbB